jgi:hypothetical protein
MRPRMALAASLAFAASLVLVASGDASHSAPSRGRSRGAAADRGARRQASAWPDAAEYSTIVTAVRFRDQALRLKAWNQKARAAQLGMAMLVTLAGTFVPGKCAVFVAHIYDELWDLGDAYAGENWQPMFAVVAHDPTVASQCRAYASLEA